MEGEWDGKKLSEALKQLERCCFKGWVSSRKKSLDSVIRPDKWVWELAMFISNM